MTISIIVATDRPLDGTTLGAALRAAGSVTVVSMHAALVAARDLDAALIAIDGDDAAAVRTLLRMGTRPGRRIVVLAQDTQAAHIGPCLLAGAHAVLGWHADAGAVAAVIDPEASRDSAAGRRAVLAARRAALQALATSESGRSPAATRVQLTALEPVRRAQGHPAQDRDGLPEDLGPAQRLVAAGLLAGKRDAQIAAAMGVTRSAVHGAKRRLATRLDVPLDQVRDALAQQRAGAR